MSPLEFLRRLFRPDAPSAPPFASAGRVLDDNPIEQNVGVFFDTPITIPPKGQAEIITDFEAGTTVLEIRDRDGKLIERRNGKFVPGAAPE